MATVLLGAAFPLTVGAAADYKAELALLVADHQVEEALQLAQQWAAEEPDSPQAQLACGDLAVRCGNFGLAAQCYEEAFFLAELPQTAVKLGDALRQDRSLDAALSSYRRALDMDSTMAAAHCGIAMVHMQRPDQALEARLSVQSALAIDPDDPACLVALATLDWSEGKTDAARQQLEAVLRTSPATAQAHLLLGRILAGAGETALARDHWQAYVDLEPARPEAWLLQQRLFPTDQRTLPIRGSGFVFSPDGKQIAYIGAGATARQQLLVVSMDATDKPRVVHEFEDPPVAVVWSPDGKRLACRTYHRPTDGNKQDAYVTVWTVSAWGQDARRICRGRYFGTPAWMPDGSGLCLDEYVLRRGRAIRVYPDEPEATASGDLLTLGAGHSSQTLAWNSAGDAMVVASVASRPTRRWDITIFRGDDLGDAYAVWSGPEPMSYPTFTPSGKAILFLQRDTQRSYGVYASATGGEPQAPTAVLKGPYLASPPSISPDGRSLLTYTKGGVTLVRLGGL